MSSFFDEPIEATETKQEQLATYTGTDPRILNISYSGLLTFHTCPRKFQLERLGATSDQEESTSESITFSFGHCVGLGIQLSLEGKSWEEIIWRLFLEWKCDLFAENIKQNKSFASAVYAVEKFRALVQQGYLDGFSLVTYEGKPACELSFLISLPNGFKYRGFVDAVLQHETTGKVIVLEVKTSSATTVNPATYKNSAQAIGYSVVLDAIFPELSSYEVLYIVYSTKQYEYTQFPFSKSYVQRARWIRELVLDTELIGVYEQADLYPMHGESCFDFYRECKFMGLCQMDTSKLAAPLTEKAHTELLRLHGEFQINVTLEQLIEHQLKKVGAE